jgi:hypothetical protein
LPEREEWLDQLVAIASAIPENQRPLLLRLADAVANTYAGGRGRDDQDLPRNPRGAGDAGEKNARLDGVSAFRFALQCCDGQDRSQPGLHRAQTAVRKRNWDAGRPSNSQRPWNESNERNAECPWTA